MPTQPVMVKYTPGSANPWSQAPAETIGVPAGQTTTLNWTIQVIPASAGTIVFSTTNAAPGIDFTGTGSSAWPGTPPSGNSTQWTSNITNNLPPGSSAAPFYYVVNALYTPAGGTQVAVQYDPEVEENPPSIAL